MDTIKIDALKTHCCVCGGRGCVRLHPDRPGWAACADCDGLATAGQFLIRVKLDQSGVVQSRKLLEWNFSSNSFARARRVARRLALLIRCIARCWDPRHLSVQVVFLVTAADADIPRLEEKVVLRVPCASPE